jgi:hypothetical protein
MPSNPLPLSEILPAVIPWAEANRANVLAHGRELTPDETAFASKIGILRPDLVRVLTVAQMPPPPEGLELLSKDLLDIEMAAGLTLGYGILITEGHETPRLIRHELGHVLQVERVGDMMTFLALYLEQVLHYGYHQAPFEVEAVNYESE